MSIELDMYKLPLEEANTKEMWDYCFIGIAQDERGEKATELAKKISRNIITIEYCNEVGGFLTLDGDRIECHDLADIVTGLKCRNVLFEATTLGVAELALLFHSYIPFKEVKARILYLEPDYYSKNDTDKNAYRDFKLSDKLIGFEGIPTLARELDSNTSNKIVFFVGFESGRLKRAFEDHPICERNTSLVFGVPPYRPGWENNSYHNNIRCLKERGLSQRIYYSPADNPRAAFQCLLEMHQSIGEDSELFVAPIGTKPHSIGAVLFQALYSENVGLLYDHPIKSKDRSVGHGPLHYFDVISS